MHQEMVVLTGMIYIKLIVITTLVPDKYIITLHSVIMKTVKVLVFINMISNRSNAPRKSCVVIIYNDDAPRVCFVDDVFERSQDWIV